MNTKKTIDLQTRGTEVPICSTIGKMAGGEMKLLPGESRVVYREGLSRTIDELGASTHLQVYLAEKIFDCMWWIRRLESQRVGILMNRIVMILDEYLSEGSFRAVIENQQWDDNLLKKTLSEAGWSLDGLMAEAAKLERDMMRSLDQQVGTWVKTMKGLQASYETLVNRRLIIERLKLQNASLQRDVAALSMSTTHDSTLPSSSS